MGSALATLVPQIVSKLGKLVQTGRALVVAAPTAITNPKVVAHLGLGLQQGLSADEALLPSSRRLLRSGLRSSSAASSARRRRQGASQGAGGW